MHVTLRLLSGAALALCTSFARADFTGWSYELITLGNGHVIMNVYGNFSNEADRLLNMVNSHITTDTAGGFYQAAEHPWWQPEAQNKDTSDDSFVAIDTSAAGNASSGATAGDPFFWNFTDIYGATTYNSIISHSPSGAGWYNPNPTSAFGLANGGKILVAHFVAAGSESGQPNGSVTWIAACSVKLASGITVTLQGEGTQVFPWQVPAPGAALLLALAGFSLRRRRM